MGTGSRLSPRPPNIEIEVDVRFLNDQVPTHDLTYGDVFMVPQRSSVGSRMNVDLTSHDGTGTTIPIVVANMTAVAGRRMAETVARRGGLVVLPQDIPTDVVADVISGQKPTIWCTIRRSLWRRRNRRPRSTSCLTGAQRGHRRRRGTPSHRCRHRADCGGGPLHPVAQVMSTELLTLAAGTDPQEAFAILHDSRHRLAPVVDSNGALVGVLTRTGALRATLYRPAVDAQGRLRVAAAVGINGDVAGRAAKLLEAGVDTLVVDTAHGHQEKMLEVLRQVRALDPQVPVVAGNVVTAEGVRDLVEAGADIVKVGVGPGAMCTTRMMTGVGRPQFSAVVECAAAARELGKWVWADGGSGTRVTWRSRWPPGQAICVIGSWFAGPTVSRGCAAKDSEDGCTGSRHGLGPRGPAAHRGRFAVRAGA